MSNPALSETKYHKSSVNSSSNNSNNHNIFSVSVPYLAGPTTAPSVPTSSVDPLAHPHHSRLNPTSAVSPPYAYSGGASMAGAGVPPKSVDNSSSVQASVPQHRYNGTDTTSNMSNGQPQGQTVAKESTSGFQVLSVVHEKKVKREKRNSNSGFDKPAVLPKMSTTVCDGDMVDSVEGVTLSAGEDEDETDEEEEDDEEVEIVAYNNEDEEDEETISEDTIPPKHPVKDVKIVQSAPIIPPSQPLLYHRPPTTGLQTSKSVPAASQATTTSIPPQLPHPPAVYTPALRGSTPATTFLSSSANSSITSQGNTSRPPVAPPAVVTQARPLPRLNGGNIASPAVYQEGFGPVSAGGPLVKRSSAEDTPTPLLTMECSSATSPPTTDYPREHGEEVYQPASRFRKARIQERIEHWREGRSCFHDCRVKTVPSKVLDLVAAKIEHTFPVHAALRCPFCIGKTVQDYPCNCTDSSSLILYNVASELPHQLLAFWNQGRRTQLGVSPSTPGCGSQTSHTPGPLTNASLPPHHSSGVGTGGGDLSSSACTTVHTTTSATSVSYASPGLHGVNTDVRSMSSQPSQDPLDAAVSMDSSMISGHHLSRSESGNLVPSLNATEVTSVDPTSGRQPVAEEPDVVSDALDQVLAEGDGSEELMGEIAGVPVSGHHPGSAKRTPERGLETEDMDQQNKMDMACPEQPAPPTSPASGICDRLISPGSAIDVHLLGAMVTAASHSSSPPAAPSSPPPPVTSRPQTTNGVHPTPVLQASTSQPGHSSTTGQPPPTANGQPAHVRAQSIPTNMTSYPEHRNAQSTVGNPNFESRLENRINSSLDVVRMALMTSFREELDTMRREIAFLRDQNRVNQENWERAFHFLRQYVPPDVWEQQAGVLNLPSFHYPPTSAQSAPPQQQPSVQQQQPPGGPSAQPPAMPGAKM